MKSKNISPLLILGFALVAIAAWNIFRDGIGSFFSLAVDVGPLLILGTPLVLISVRRFRATLQSRPQVFWYLGAAMVAFAVLSLVVFVAVAKKYPSLPLNGALLGLCFSLLFGGGFMVLATPTIFAISNAFKQSKEQE